MSGKVEPLPNARTSSSFATPPPLRQPSRWWYLTHPPGDKNGTTKQHTMAAKRTYYEILEISQDAELIDIKKAYRRLALK